MKILSSPPKAASQNKCIKQGNKTTYITGQPHTRQPEITTLRLTKRNSPSLTHKPRTLAWIFLEIILEWLRKVCFEIFLAQSFDAINLIHPSQAIQLFSIWPR